MSNNLGDSWLGIAVFWGIWVWLIWVWLIWGLITGSKINKENKNVQGHGGVEEGRDQGDPL